MQATIPSKLKIYIVGVALAATGFVLGAAGAAWAQDDGSTHDMADCPMYQSH